MIDWLKQHSDNVWSSAALLAVSIVVFASTRGTQYQQLGIGLLTASITLIVAMAAFEAVWENAARSLVLLDDEGAPRNGQNSHRADEDVSHR